MRHLRNGTPRNSISLLDRGLHYGDGLFETILIHKNKCILWKEHLERLQDGCKRLALPSPGASILKKEAKRLIHTTQEGILKIILTRGESERGYAIPSHPKPTRILSLFPPPFYPKKNWQEGIHAMICRTQLSCTPDLAGIKHLNRLEQVLARSEWKDPNIAEGLMQSTENRVIEGTMSNVFLEKEGVFHTPSLQECGVAGVMRRFLLNFFEKAGWPYEVRPIIPAEVFEANSLFFCNSLFGIWPVLQLDHYKFCISPKIRKLQKCLPPGLFPS
ncbi:MAG: aminodeoxychorismate lyase [Gammaproteobacteria bacterium]|nr:aminodeoxychorismate lyase [Gammaproteobacteria bacterium]